MQNRMLNKGVVVITICLLVLTSSVPLVSGENLQLNHDRVLVEEKRMSACMKGLIDNVEIKCIGLLCFVDLLLAMLNLPVFYIRTRVQNKNDEPIHIKRHITLTVKDGRVLDDFDDDVSFQFPSGYMLTTLYFTRYDWQRFEYMWGRFDITLELRILEDASGVKLVFHGFIFNIGAVIINPKGEILDD